MKTLLKQLTEAWGPSGYEHHVRDLIRREVADLADEITVDPLGNLICRVGSGGKKILVDAHMDEIGLMALFTEPKTGYLRFVGIGGLNKNTLTGGRVKFENGTTGVIGLHDIGNAEGLSDLENFYIDVSDGNGSTLVREGNPATFWREFEERGTRWIGKAMDDRVGCLIAIEAMRRLNRQSANEVYFVFAVQEEVGLRGAGAAAYAIDPDVAIALDVTHTGDMPKGPKMAIQLGQGAAIKIHDPGLVVPPAVRDWMIQTAQQHQIPYQLELLVGGSTDAAKIQTTRAGVPSGCISIPCRYIHTTSETVDARDVQACVDLLIALISNPVPELVG
ncbi:MAG: M20/M25/M40 family metallo-hydrolase [Anaerolineae bacterium]|nr:M20/M25/M40 family metallo-hydrolase [Anaerolineae bacterium]